MNMALIHAAIMKCNSCFKNEDDFIFNEMLQGISINGNKVLDVILHLEPEFVDMEYISDYSHYPYFKGLDLSQGVNHYMVNLSFKNVKECIDAAESGFIFELGYGVVMQIMAYEVEEDENYRDLKVIQKNCDF